MSKITLFSSFIGGFVGVIIQATLVRELLVGFIGNELVFGIILGNWVMSSAIGSLITGYVSSKWKFTPINALCFLFLIFVLFLPIAIFISKVIKSIFGYMPGMVPNILSIYFFSLICVFFVCVFLGAIYSLCVRTFADMYTEKKKIAGIFYYIESIGAIFGGIFFTYFLTKYSSFTCAFLCCFSLLLPPLFYLWKIRGKTLMLAYSIVSIIFFVMVLNSKTISYFSLQKQWNTKDIPIYRNSKFGNITVTALESQYTVFFNGLPIATLPIGNIGYNEDFTHFSAGLHYSPKKVLLVGGGVSGILDELLKYSNCISYIEPDPELIEVINEISDKRYKNVNFIYTDAKSYISQTKEKFDIVLINFTLPSSLELNRFYTFEFFNTVKGLLKDDGIFQIALVGNLTYYDHNLRLLNSSVYSTLTSVFRDVLVIPGDGYNLFICSDSELNKSADLILSRINERGVVTKLFNKPYLENRLSDYWRNWYLENIEKVKPRKNSDFLPICTFYSVAHWNTSLLPKLEFLFKVIEGIKVEHILCFVFTCFFIYFILFSRSKNGVYWIITANGFNGMGVSLMLMLLFQIFKGYIYEKIAFLISMFMLGLALGSLCSNNYLIKSCPEKKLLFVELFYISFFCSIFLIKFLNFEFIFYLFSLLGGLLTGVVFPLGNSIMLEKTKDVTIVGSKLYGLDLLGAYFGSVLIGTFFLPLFGLTNVLVFMIILKILSVVLIYHFHISA